MKPSRIIACIAAVLAVATSSLAQQSGSTPTAQQVEEAKKAGAAAAGVGMNQTYTRGSDGQAVVGADGKPVLQQKSGNTMRDSLTDFQTMTGVSGMEQTGSPANRDKTGGAKVSINNFSDFSCGTYVTPQFSAGPFSFRVVRCDLDSAQNGTVTLRMCDKALEGGTCSSAKQYVGTTEQREAEKAEDERSFSAPFQLQSNATSTLGDVSLSLGCNSTNLCRLTVTGTYSYGGNDETLKQKSNEAIGEQKGFIGDLTKASSTYATEVRKVGADMAACNAANNNPGEVRACSPEHRDQNVARLDTPQNNGQCTGARQCLKEALQTYTYTKSCTRSFAMTERITKSVIEETATCTVEEKPDAKDVLVKTSSCSATQLNGSTIVAQTEKVCTAKKTVAGKEECIAWSWTEYRAKVDSPRVLSQTADPPVTGACDTNPLSETRSLQCEGANWFGRVLPATECSATYYDEATGAAVGSQDLDFRNKPGCGVCLTPAVSELCYGAAESGDPSNGGSCDAATLAGCSLKSRTPRNYSGDGGLVTTQEETYECAKETRQCVQWSAESGDSSCVSTNMAHGLDNTRVAPATADGSMNAAMVAAATVDATGKGVEENCVDSTNSSNNPNCRNLSDVQQTPKLFTGDDQRCNRPTGGFVGSILQRSCCRMDIQRPSSRRLTQKGCTEDEARLAAARRSSYAHYVGEYCSKKLGWPFKSCVRRTETYCTFPGILPKIVHQQGRKQLEEMAAGGKAQATKGTLGFKYYDAGGGSWSNPVEINGVKVAAWQWPNYCADPAKAAETLLSSATAKECSGYLTVWFAACDTGECDALPEQPSEGSFGWTLQQANPLENVTTGLNRYAVATGACAPGSVSCQYTISAWPVGRGGHAVVTRDLTWPLYANFQQERATTAEGAPTSAAYQMNNIGDLMFKGYSSPGMAQGAVPATVRLDFSRDGGQTWATHQVPTNLKGRDYTLTEDVTMTGYCDAVTNLCGYRVTGTTVVTAKPWGDPKSPDCTGFTPGQLAAMDFSKMDLSEWLDSVMSKVSEPNREQLTEVANAQFQEYNSHFQNGQGTVKATRPTSANFARMVPYEGFGPFFSKVKVAGFWPEVTGDPTVDIQKVTAVTIDWGDCTPVESLVALPPEQGKGFTQRDVRGHQYDDPKLVYIRCGLGEQERNFMHKVKLTVSYTDKQGTSKSEVVFLSVENAWATMPGSTNNNVYVPVKEEVKGPVDTEKMPPPPNQ